MCMITSHFCTRCRGVVDVVAPCDGRRCVAIFENPVRVRELCAYCEQRRQQIEETQAAIDEMRKHLHNARMEDLVKGMEGVSVGQREREGSEEELRGLEERMRELMSR